MLMMLMMLMKPFLFFRGPFSEHGVFCFILASEASASDSASASVSVSGVSVSVSVSVSATAHHFQKVMVGNKQTHKQNWHWH